MELMSQVIPALIIIIANLAGGDHESETYEVWTSIFGWTAGVSLVLVFLSGWVWPAATSYLTQISGFSLLTALSRDYEKIFKPFFNKSNRK